MADHDETPDEESYGEDDDIPPSPEPRKTIDPGFLPNDIVLVIEDERLHVNKALLESASPVFEAWLKKEWEKQECIEGTKTELVFPGKTYDEMVTFLKCLLPNFPDEVTDEALDTVLPLADEYRTEKLITECVAVIRQRVESVAETDVYIPPSRIITYLLWIEKYNLSTVKEAVMKLASCLNNEKLAADPGYEQVGVERQMEICNARAKLLASLFVANVTEAKEKMNRLEIPRSIRYLAQWKQIVEEMVKDELASPISEDSTWPVSVYRKKISNRNGGISPTTSACFACLEICDRFMFSNLYEETIKRIKLLKIGKADFKYIWSRCCSSYFDNANSTERHSRALCACT